MLSRARTGPPTPEQIAASSAMAAHQQVEFEATRAALAPYVESGRMALKVAQERGIVFDASEED